MTQNEQILEYIDGMLDPHAEQALFDAMARQPELRSALRQFIVIGDAVRVDREAYTPPAHVERALMAGLGLAPLAPAAGTGMATGFMAKLAVLGGRFGRLIVAFMLGALLAGGSVYMLTGSDETGSIASSDGDRIGNGRRGTEAPAGSLPQMEDGAPNAQRDGAGQSDMADRSGNAGTINNSGNANGAGAVQSPDNARQTNGELQNNQRQMNRAGTERNGAGNIRSSVRSDRMNTSRSSSARNDGSGGRGNTLARESDGARAEGALERGRSADGADLNTSIPDASSSALSPDIAPVQLRSEPRDADALRAAPVEPSVQSLPENFPVPIEIDFSEPEPEGILALEGRRNFGGPFNPNNARRSTPTLDNWMIGGYYPLDERISVGLEAGHESYDQTLYYSNNDTVQVDQRPSFLWLGLAGRYDMGALPFAGAQTFLQGTLAYSSGGPVMRLRLGGEIPLFTGLDLMAGLETSALIYTFDNQRSITGRWGLTTGVKWTLR